MFEANTMDNQVSNEVSYQNLINIANNPILFRALDEETQQMLIDTIRIYTVDCLENISLDYHFKKAKERMNRGQ